MNMLVSTSQCTARQQRDTEMICASGYMNTELLRISKGEPPMTTSMSRNSYHNGRSPLYAAFVLGSWRNVTRWLILNGALCKDGDSGKLGVEIMKQDLGPIYNCVSIQESINNSIRVHTRKALLPIFTEPALWFSCFCQGYSPLLPSTHTAPAETYPH